MDIKVEEYTSSTPHTVDLNVPLGEAISLMKEKEVRHFPVVEGSEVVGVISERDLLANYGKPWSEHLRVKDIMSTSLLSVSVNDGLGDVAFRLSREKRGSAIVLADDGSLYGIFTTTDALNALVEILAVDGQTSLLLKR